MDPIVRENLGAVARHPHLARVLENPDSRFSQDQYQLEMAKNGMPCLTVRREQGKTFTYHSRYDPQQEARRQVEPLMNGPAHVLVFGFGFGYALEEILSRLPEPPQPNTVLVVEPDPKVMQLALASRSLKRLLEDPRVVWAVGMNQDEIGDIWNQILNWGTLDSLVVYEHPTSLARFSEFFEQLKSKLRYMSNRSRGNLVTLMNLGFEFHSNCFYNLADAMRFPGVQRLFQKFQGVPAVIVAAGPSLEKNVHLLSQVKGKFLIIAVDTAFRQLVSRGLKPDIVCAADPSYLNSLDFVGVEDVEDVILAVAPIVHPDIVKSFAGPKIWMSFGGGISPWVEAHREPFGKVICWGSIATTAFDLARQLGCDPIIFIGLDLSFQDGLLYARGSYSDDVFFDKVHPLTSLEHEIADYIATKGVYRVTGEKGQLLFTDQNMHMYAQWFEDQFRQTKAEVINATEGGVVNKHVTRLSLAETISRFQDRGTDIRKILEGVWDQPVKADFPGLVTKMRSIVNRLRELREKARMGLQNCRKLDRCEGKTEVKDLAAKFMMLMEDTCRLHDTLVEPGDLLNWLSLHQTKFITRHTMQIRKLREKKDALIGDWLPELKELFEAFLRFFEYQTPLLERAIADCELLRGKEGGRARKKEDGAHDHAQSA